MPEGRLSSPSPSPDRPNPKMGSPSAVNFCTRSFRQSATYTSPLLVHGDAPGHVELALPIAQLAEPSQVGPVLVESLDPVVHRIDDQEVVVAVECDPRRTVQLALSAARLSPLGDQVPLRGDHGYLVGAFVREPQVAVAPHDDRLGPYVASAAHHPLGPSRSGAESDQVEPVDVLVVQGEMPDVSDAEAAAAQDEQMPVRPDGHVRRGHGQTPHPQSAVVWEADPQQRVWSIHLSPRRA